MKSIDSTISVHRSLRFSFSLLWMSLAAVSLSSLEFASLWARSRSSHSSSQFAAPSRDVLTGGVQRHFTVVIIGFIHHHIVSAMALSHRTYPYFISAMSSRLGLSPKCVQLVVVLFRSHVAAPHIQFLLSR